MKSQEEINKNLFTIMNNINDQAFPWVRGVADLQTDWLGCFLNS
jgi:hypothetical protein